MKDSTSAGFKLLEIVSVVTLLLIIFVLPALATSQENRATDTAHFKLLSSCDNCDARSETAPLDH